MNYFSFSRVIFLVVINKYRANSAVPHDISKNKL
uniref:Uncharacterized protein n=1 Tax=Anguilla anguilla TaxID=7936 RepID=A0A0E9R0C9_ANGAN